MSSTRPLERTPGPDEGQADHALGLPVGLQMGQTEAAVAAPQWVAPRAPSRYVSAADAALVASCIAGDPTAWESFIHRFQGRVFNVTFHMTHDAERAADLAQEALLQILRSLPRFRGEASLTTWIHGLTMRVCLHHLRRERRRQADSWEEISAHRAEPISAEGRPLESVSRKQVQLLVHQAVSQLSLPFRSVIVLHGLAGMTYEDTAAALHLPVNTVKTRVHRAKAKLRVWLERTMGDEVDAL